MTGEYSNTISEKSMPVYKSLDELEDIDVASGEVYAGVPPSDIATQKGDKLEEASASIAAAEQIAQAEKQRAKSPR